MELGWRAWFWQVKVAGELDRDSCLTVLECQEALVGQENFGVCRSGMWGRAKEVDYAYVLILEKISGGGVG